MSSVTVTIPKDYGYVLASVTSAFLVGSWHMITAGSKRKAAKVPYPRPYAFDDAAWSNDGSYSEASKAKYIFNCSQRAHAQYLEHLGIAVPAMLIAGVGYPVTTAVLGATWSVNRVVYAVGYMRADKDRGSGRLVGSGYALAEIALIGLCGKMAFDLIMA